MLESWNYLGARDRGLGAIEILIQDMTDRHPIQRWRDGCFPIVG